MSVRTQSRRLARPVTALLKSQGPSFILPIRSTTQLRYASEKKSQKALKDATANPLIEAYERSKEEEKAKLKDSPQSALASPTVPRLASGSIFADEFKQVEQDLNPTPAEERVPEENPTDVKDRVWATMRAALDPVPMERLLWQRKQVARAVRKNWRMTREELLQHTERKIVHSNAAFWPVGTKKLGMLARQIAGKTVGEAMLQMQFSKKRYAEAVRASLATARDRAIAQKGMALGGDYPNGDVKKIEAKDGRKIKIRNDTTLYVDQAWVTPGKVVKSGEARARGRQNTLRHRSSRLYILVKEEKTRIREAAERQTKRDNRKLWTQLPDRPVTFQHQHCLW